MVKVNLLWLLLIAGGLLAFLAVTYYRFARAREWLGFYRRVCENMNFYFMCYDILRDEVILSAPTAAMLGIESPVRNFSHRVKQEGGKPGLPLYPLDQCLRSYEKDRFIKSAGTERRRIDCSFMPTFFGITGIGPGMS